METPTNTYQPIGNSRDATQPNSALNPTTLKGALLIAGLALLVYLPALDGAFVLDDDVYLTESKFIAAPDGLYRFWLTTQPMDYYPVSNSTLWFEWRLWQTNPTGYHITNLLLHIASALLIWAVLKQLAIPGAFLAALLFTVHPVNVESVAWIAQRKDLLAVVFFLLSIFWYLKADALAPAAVKDLSNDAPPIVKGPSGEKWFWLSLLAFLLAMLSKGSVAFLPFVLLGLMWWRRRRITLADFTTTIPFFVLAIALSALNIWCQTLGFKVTIRSAGLAERFAGAGAAIWFYLSKAFLPLNLVFIYPQWHIHSRELVWILPLASAALVTIVLWLRRNSPTAKWVCPLLFAWGVFCVALLPVLGFADVGFMRYSLVADHYQHVAIIAVVALVAAGIEYWRVTIKSAAQMAPLLAAVLIAALSILTWQQSLLFSGPIRLYSSLLDKNPECSLAHFNLGNVLFRNNQPQDAIQQYELALRYNPNYADAQANLGAALVSLGQPQDAIEHYQQAMRINPDDFDALGNMALAYAALKRPTDAIATAEKAISMARAHDEPALANQIEGWLKSYRAEQAKKLGSASPSQNVPAAP